MTSTTFTTRCRFRFGLRTLFVVMTVVACWLGYSMHWIRERHATIAACPDGIMIVNIDPVRAACGLWMFGEEGFGLILYEKKVNASTLEPLRQQFPEANFEAIEWATRF